MKILSAEFVTSAVAGRALPRDADVEVALVGRSNVGKSSLINALTRKRIARTSAAPGKTQLANFYRVTVQSGPGRVVLYLVDLPGYGYARGGPDAAEQLKAVSEAHFASRAPLRRAAKSDPGSRTPAPGPGSVLLLVDARHPGLDADRHAFTWLTSMGATAHVVATKVDKLPRSERTRNLRQLERAFGNAALPVSSLTGEGLDDVWDVIVKGGRGNRVHGNRSGG